MARHHHQEQRQQQQRAGWGRLPLLLRWLVIPMASSLAFAVHLPPRGDAAGGISSSSRRIGGLMGGAGPRAMHPSSFLLPQGRAVGVELQARRGQGGCQDLGQDEWHQRREQAHGGWLREGGLGLVRGGGGGDGGIIGGGGGGGGSGGGGGGGGGSGQGKNSGGAIVFVAALGTFKSLWGQYAELLESKPVVTKAITAGLIALVGDVCAQLFEHKLTCRRLGKEGDKEAQPPLKIDLLRCLAVTIEGIAITGPGLHYLYSTLERLVPAQKGALAAITHVAVDEFIFDPLFVLGFFFLCGAIEGKDLRKEIVPQVRREYWPALKGGWMVSLLFLPLEFATFRCLPLKMRVLVVNLTDVVWTAVVSYFSHLEDQWGAKGAKAH